jgi:hypothetical protein
MFVSRRGIKNSGLKHSLVGKCNKCVFVGTKKYPCNSCIRNPKKNIGRSTFFSDKHTTKADQAEIRATVRSWGRTSHSYRYFKRGRKYTKRERKLLKRKGKWKGRYGELE